MEVLPPTVAPAPDARVTEPPWSAELTAAATLTEPLTPDEAEPLAMSTSPPVAVPEAAETEGCGWEVSSCDGARDSDSVVIQSDCELAGAKNSVAGSQWKRGGAVQHDSQRRT